ncbi:MAG: polysaccharide deacetylase family protein [Caldithrix sp.]|nr:polysaccharide deacetylase family protein [Caldithrix sp.]
MRPLKKIKTIAAGRPFIIYGSGLLLLLLLTYNCSHINRGLAGMFSSIYPSATFIIDTDQKLVALTIDDSPHDQSTDRILRVLDAYNARATFFVITDSTRGREHIVRRILDAGHEIGHHMTADTPSIRLETSRFKDRFTHGDSLLRSWTNVRWFRPASGLYNAQMSTYLADRHPRYRIALGTVYPLDAAIPSSGFSTFFIKHSVSPGSIIILHDGAQRGQRTAETLKRVLPYLKQQGYRVVTLTRLMSAASIQSSSGSVSE